MANEIEELRKRLGELTKEAERLEKRISMELKKQEIPSYSFMIEICQSMKDICLSIRKEILQLLERK